MTAERRALVWVMLAGATAVWMTLRADAGFVLTATLGLTILVWVWFATVDPSRLVDEHHRPHPMLFLLAIVGVAILVTGSVAINRATTLMMVAVGSLAVVTGLVRAVRHGMRA